MRNKERAGVNKKPFFILQYRYSALSKREWEIKKEPGWIKNHFLFYNTATMRSKKWECTIAGL